MKVYLAGPMTGYPDFNAAGFARAEKFATSQGWTTVSPQYTDPSHPGDCPGGEQHATAVGSHPYPCWIRASLKLLLDCDAIFLLEGWAQSKGARLERGVAELCGMRIMEEER